MLHLFLNVLRQNVTYLQARKAAAKAAELELVSHSAKKIEK